MKISEEREVVQDKEMLDTGGNLNIPDPNTRKMDTGSQPNFASTIGLVDVMKEKAAKVGIENPAVLEDGIDPKKKNDTGGGGGGHGIQTDHPTSYIETMMHLFKGNVGPGLFAMGDAFKNGGIIVAPILTVILGLVCVHSQHLLLNCSKKMKQKLGTDESPDFAETVELCFENGPPKLRPWSKTMKLAVNIFLCVVQLGFCSVYFVFISSNLKQVFDKYDMVLDVHIHMVIILIPILLPSLITNLKYLAWCSTVANVCMILGIGITMYYSVQELPAISERNYFTNFKQLPLFFGTAIFAFEGISLVLPLQNAMKNPHNFRKNTGVLNVGMVTVTTIFTTFGFIGYLKYGENVEGSLTLNLPADKILAQSVKLFVSLGVLLGYALQFFVAIQIMWPGVKEKFSITMQHPLITEVFFRIFFVLVTFMIAEFVPKLNLFISLIGALCSTALALVFPPVIQLILEWAELKGPSAFVLVKNIFILILALLGFLTGSYESLSAIAKEFGKSD